MKFIEKNAIFDWFNIIVFTISFLSLCLFAEPMSPVGPDTRDLISKNLKAMSYTTFKIARRYTLEDCPHGHLNFSVHFKGKQYGYNRQGYFCYPYNHEQVVYYEGKLRF